jgi:hypothetical protein
MVQTVSKFLNIFKFLLSVYACGLLSFLLMILHLCSQFEACNSYLTHISHIYIYFLSLIQNEDVIILYLCVLQKVCGLLPFCCSFLVHPHFLDF